MLWLFLFILLVGIGVWMTIVGLKGFDRFGLAFGGIMMALVGAIFILCYFEIGVSNRGKAITLGYDLINIENQVEMIEHLKATNFEGSSEILIVDMVNRDLGLSVNRALVDLNKSIRDYNDKIAKLRILYQNRKFKVCWKDYTKNIEVLKYKDVYPTK